VLTPAEVLGDDHLQVRGAWAELALPTGRAGRIPRGCLEVNGRRAGYRAPLDESGARRSFSPVTVSGTENAGPCADGAGPLSGLRVLDLGVIVIGAETGRLFADLGADVIKIESRAFPDGSRASAAAGTVSPSFAWGHRNKRSLGIDLRHPQGKELFLRLAEVSDVVLSNFKPGTLESLGLGYKALREVNPRIVVVDSSALGSSGPASRRMGYGPLVRARTGLTSLWRYLDRPESYCDGLTVYPDHTAARIGAAGALAALIARRRTGRGGTVSISQAEVMLTQFSAEFLRETFDPGTLVPIGNRGEFDAPWGVYACAGDDQWCVITIRAGAGSLPPSTPGT
jgi:crotonobetainyl-CoA:carnitine CoA-transferase CaiB-like acyl-CoA transferase